MRPALLALALACGLILSACGNSPTAVPTPLRPRPPGTLAAVAFPTAGLEIDLPANQTNWPRTVGPSPLLIEAFSGTAAIAVWRYPRQAPLPRTGRELRAARQALLADELDRDPTFLLRSAVFTRAGGHAAIELLARETVAGELRAVRSTHVYAHGSEYVIDELAPPGIFRREDREVFLPVLATLRLSRPALG